MKKLLDKILKNEKPILIDFHLDWCGPNEALGSTLMEISKLTDKKLEVMSIDVKKDSSIEEYFKVEAIPSLALFKEGKVIWSKTGSSNPHDVINEIEKLI
jgi:thioredoxin 1